MTEALAKTVATETGLVLSIERALKHVQEAKSLPELRDIRDEGQLLTGLARSRDASREVQNGAAEITLRATRRIGEILDAQKQSGERATPTSTLRRGPSAPGESTGSPAPARPPTLAEMGIDRNLARKAQVLAKMPEAKLETYVQAQKEHPAGEITLSGALKVATSKNPHAASRVNDGDPEKNDRFTEAELVRELHERFRFTVDAAGHPEAPATKIIGRCYTVQDDGLEQDYADELPFTNCPWDFIPRWAQLIFEWTATGRTKRWVLLIPGNRFEQPWAQEWVEPYRPDRGGAGVRVENLRGRRRYGQPGDPEGHDSNQPNMPSALVIFEGPFRHSPDFPPLVECGCSHKHSEGLPCTWDGCECKVGVGESDRIALVEAAGATVDALPGAERSALARVGVNALVDEATGYQDVRPKDDLRQQLKRERASKRAPADLTADRFIGEATDLGYRAKTPRSTLVAARCQAKGCKVEFRLPVASGHLPRKLLQQLRQHTQQHQAAKAKGRKR